MNIRQWFYRQSIQSKLILVNVAVIALTLVIVFCSISVYEYQAVKSATVQELKTQAAIVSDSVSTAMAFGDKKSANEGLASLAVSPDILNAHLILPNQVILASYSRVITQYNPAWTMPFLALPQSWGKFSLVYPVKLKGNTVGSLIIECSLHSFYKRMLKNLVTTMLISLLGFLLSIAFSLRMQRVITRPLYHLTEVSERIATEGNYNIAPQSETDDEFGGLSRALNNMIFKTKDRFNTLVQDSVSVFQSLAENTPDIVIRYDKSLKCVLVNKAFSESTGLPTDSVVNEPFNKTWFADNISANDFEAILNRLLADGGRERLLLEWSTNQQHVSYDALLVAEKDLNGQPTGIFLYARNISNLKAIERDLQESRALIQEWAIDDVRAIEEERKHIAREIHDELGQLLTHLRLKIQMLAMRLNATSVAPVNVADIVNVVDRAIGVVRNVSTSLRPSALDAGLISSIEWLVSEYTQTTGTPCSISTNLSNGPSILDKLDDNVTTQLFRITQESLTNVTRHAQASKVSICLTADAQTLMLSIEDNGIGFDTHQKRSKHSLGLVGMGERVKIIQGQLNIISQLNSGTQVRVCLPRLQSESNT